jgi:hypothetical protein
VPALAQTTDSYGQAAVAFLQNGDIYEWSGFQGSAHFLGCTNNAVALAQTTDAYGQPAVAFLQGGNVYVWSATTGRQQLRVSGVQAADGSIWFAGDHAIYRLSNGQMTQMPGS